MDRDPRIMKFLEKELFPFLTEFYHGTKAEVQNHETKEWSNTTAVMLRPEVECRKKDDELEFKFPFRIKPEPREFWVAISPDGELRIRNKSDCIWIEPGWSSLKVREVLDD